MKLRGLLVRFPKLGYYYVKFRRSATRSPEEVEREQWKRFKGILRFAYENNELYHRKLRIAGVKPDDIAEKRDLLKIPTVTKEEIRFFPHGALSHTHRLEDCILASTSGSTGTPLVWALDLEGVLQKMAINLRTCEMSHYHLGEKLVQCARPLFFYSPPEGLGQKLLNIMVRRKYLSPFKTDVKIAVDAIVRYRPAAVVGFTSFIRLLADYFRGEAGELSVRSLMTTGEMLLPSTRRVIGEAFGAEVFDQYGSEELGWVSGECLAHQGYHINAETVLIEFMKEGEHCAAGEGGEIVATSLISRAVPFIRYEIEDIGAPLEGSCSCGRGLPLMTPIQGRVQDLLCTSWGSYVIPDQARSIIRRHVGEVSLFQVIQEPSRKVVIKIVEEKPLSKYTSKLIVRQFKEYLGDVEVEVEVVREIPREGGKHHYVKSLVPRNHRKISVS